MTLKKDINIVAYLIQHRIEFKSLNKTIEVDESKLDERVVFLLEQYQTEKEQLRPTHYVKLSKSKKKLHKERMVRKSKKKSFIEVMDNIGVELISYEEYRKLYPKPIVKVTKPIDIKKVVKFADALPIKIDQRPKSEYSNPQWQDYYKD